MSIEPIDPDGKLDVMDEIILRYLPHCAITESSRLAEHRQACREGNPFPLIAYQFPSLVIESGDKNSKYFQGVPGSEDNPCLRLDDWQRDEIIGRIFDDSLYEIAIKGCTGPGKGMAVAVGINLWFDVFDPCKIILTSSDFAHARDNIFAEVVKWRRMMTEPAVGTVLASEIVDNKQHYITVRNPKVGSDTGAFSGQHSPHTLFCFDEASGLPSERYEDACKQARRIIAIGNPRVLSGWFYRLWDPCGSRRDTTQTVVGSMGNRHCVTIGGMDCMNVRHKRLKRKIAPPCGIKVGDEEFSAGKNIPRRHWDDIAVLIPAQCDYAQYQGICQHADPRHVAVFADGKFPDEDPTKQVILASWLPRHLAAWKESNGKVDVDCFGFDVGASMAGDASVLSAGSEDGLAGLHTWKHDNVVEHANKILDIARESYGIDLTEGRVPVVVDKIGVGKGTSDKLRELGVYVLDFDAGSTSTVEREHINLRAESYSFLGRRLNPQDRWKDEEWMLLDDEELQAELCAPEKVYPSGDALRWKLQPKDEVRAKIGRSPDKADSVVMMYWGVTKMAENWYGKREIVASGEDPRERDRLSNEDIKNLPKWLRETVEGLSGGYGMVDYEDD